MIFTVTIILAATLQSNMFTVIQGLTDYALSSEYSLFSSDQSERFFAGFQPIREVLTGYVIVKLDVNPYCFIVLLFQVLPFRRAVDLFSFLLCEGYVWTLL